MQVVLRVKVKCTKGELKCEGRKIKGHGKFKGAASAEGESKMREWANNM